MLRLLTVLILVSLPLAGWAASGETLQLRAVYQGLLSAGKPLPIADVVLHTRRPAEGYLETRMDISSEAYSVVESLYPVRYRFRTWYLPDGSGAVAFESFQRKRGDRVRHRLINLDDPQQAFVIRNPAVDGGPDLTALETGEYQARRPGGRFDRLGMLQHLRGMQLSPGQQVRLAVNTGKRMLEYRVSVEKAETIELAGEQRPALKLRFDGLKMDQHGVEEHDHRPVYIWLSDDRQRLPLRAVSRHALGRFTVELVADAGAAPGLPQESLVSSAR